MKLISAHNQTTMTIITPHLVGNGDTSDDPDDIFTGGNKDKNVIAETQLEFDDQDIALSGNVDGIGNIQTFKQFQKHRKRE